MDWDWTALGTALRERRKELHETQEELAVRAGVHAATIKDYESGQVYTRLPRSWERLEPAIGWAKGSARAVLEGGRPTLLPGAGPSSSTRERISSVNEFAQTLVRELTLVVAPDTPLSEIVRLERLAVEIALQHGWPEPPIITITREAEPNP